MILTAAFFNRPTLTVASELLGKRLCRRVSADKTDDRQNRQIRQHARGRDMTISGIISETEAYDGPHDRASHASRGRTPRTEVMFGPPGTIYAYLVYGMHWCLNVVTGPQDYPAAVLIRGLVVDGLPLAATNGPGKVCRILKITGQLNARSLARASGLWVEDAGIRVPMRQIKKTPRIGVDYAGAYRDKPWRFLIGGVWSMK